jgi:hypothetical protein
VWGCMWEFNSDDQLWAKWKGRRRKTSYTMSSLSSSSWSDRVIEGVDPRGALSRDMGVGSEFDGDFTISPSPCPCPPPLPPRTANRTGCVSARHSSYCCARVRWVCSAPASRSLVTCSRHLEPRPVVDSSCSQLHTRLYTYDVCFSLKEFVAHDRARVDMTMH